MKLAEALLQDRPIKRKEFKQWCKPEIVESNHSYFGAYSALPTVCGMDKYTLDYKNMSADDWEVKQEPMKFEFECRWDVSSRGHYYPNSCALEPLIEMQTSGKKFKVTCEEIVE